MTRTHLEASWPEKLNARPNYTPMSAATHIEAALGVPQKMLTQQLRQLEADGIVEHTV